MTKTKTPWVESDHGDGRLVPGVPCHECGGRVLYNGNYFCADCAWINPAVMLGEFTVVDADFSNKLVEALRGDRQHVDIELREYAADYKPGKGRRRKRW